MLNRILDGRTDLVFDYLAAGNPPDGMTDGGVSLMQWCAYYGDVSAVRYLAAKGAPLELLGENLDLNGAAFHGHWRLCEFVIEQGADVNKPLADTGETPLHATLVKPDSHPHSLVVEVLLARGADPNAKTTPGVETGSFMRDCRTKGETPLHRAAAFAGVETIRRLLEAGADREARDANGETPLAWASWYCRPAPVVHTLCYGPHRVDPERKTMGENLQGRPECLRRGRT